MFNYFEIYFRDELVVKVDLDKKPYIQYLSDKMSYLPFGTHVIYKNETDEEIRNLKLLTLYLEFLHDRIVPSTRQNLKQLMRDCNIDVYTHVAFLRANHGIQTDDYHWVKLDPDDPTEYKDIKIRD